MPTIHISNHSLSVAWVKLSVGVTLLLCALLGIFFNDWSKSTLLLLALILLIAAGYWFMRKSWVGFTLTATHFQQHFYHGGWVIKWSNICQIDICSYQQEGWHQSLPWIGIRLKNYSPFLNSICPRIAREMLLNQRALLYLGAKQQPSPMNFEDIVLDSTPYKDRQGDVYTGLMAMLANRMGYQREYYGFDVYISEADLDRDASEFVGLARRYLAAAKPERTDEKELI